jgi:hypothetical protein
MKIWHTGLNQEQYPVIGVSYIGLSILETMRAETVRHGANQAL